MVSIYFNCNFVELALPLMLEAQSLEGGRAFLDGSPISFSASHEFSCEIINLSGTELFENIFHNLLGKN